MKKSKGLTLKEWTTAAGFFATEKGLTRFMRGVDLEPIYDADIFYKSVFDHIFAKLVDGVNLKCLAIYPVSKKNKFEHLLKYYDERPATSADIKENPHCLMPEPPKREKKDRTTPLFGELPECKKDTGGAKC